MAARAYSGFVVMALFLGGCAAEGEALADAATRASDGGPALMAETRVPQDDTTAAVGNVTWPIQFTAEGHHDHLVGWARPRLLKLQEGS